MNTRDRTRTPVRRSTLGTKEDVTFGPVGLHSRRKRFFHKALQATFWLFFRTYSGLQVTHKWLTSGSTVRTDALLTHS